MEKKLGIPVSFNCYIETVTLAQNQVGFINGIVLPLFSVLTEFFDLNFTVENLKKNREYCKEMKESTEKEKNKMDKNEIIKEEKELKTKMKIKIKLNIKD